MSMNQLAMNTESNMATIWTRTNVAVGDRMLIESSNSAVQLIGMTRRYAIVLYDTTHTVDVAEWCEIEPGIRREKPLSVTYVHDIHALDALSWAADALYGLNAAEGYWTKDRHLVTPVINCARRRLLAACAILWPNGPHRDARIYVPIDAAS